MLVRSMLADGHGIEGTNDDTFMLFRIPTILLLKLPFPSPSLHRVVMTPRFKGIQPSTYEYILNFLSHISSRTNA